MRALYRGAHVLIHDATYTPADQATRRNRGFSSYEQAADAAIAAKVERLVTFHYDQDHGDVDALRDACCAHLDAHGGKDIELAVVVREEAEDSVGSCGAYDVEERAGWIRW